MTFAAAARKSALVCALGAVLFLGAASAPRNAPGALADPTETCAGVPDGSSQTVAAPGAPCWVQVSPYPFGADGNPVDPNSAACATTNCYLIVTSMAFRAWNRGLAATTTGTPVNPGGGRNAFGVWLFNGTRWYPDPTFPGSSVCQGNTVLWAGKLDYWLIGPGQNGWAPLCRFDGSNFLWEPLPMPPATLDRLGGPSGGLPPRGGGITSGSCLAWDNCWFFGTAGTILHWDGAALTDVSPDSPTTWAGTTFTAATLTTSSGGSSIGLATAGTSYTTAVSGGIPLPTRAGLPAQLFSLDGTTAAGRRVDGSAVARTAYIPPAAAEAADTSGDPFGTDPIALSLDASGRGWVAANPAGWEVGVGTPSLRPELDARERSPLLPLTTGPGISTGPDARCPNWFTEDGLDRFPHTYDPVFGTLPGSTLWTSISAFPGGESALAGGQEVSTLPEGIVAGEPVLVQANCDGTSTLTRFRIRDPGGSGVATPADEKGWVEAVAANAPNDGWAATTDGRLFSSGLYEPPHLYRFTDGTPPQAPAGDDKETRTITVQQNPPTYVYKPPPPPPLPPPPRGSKTRHLPPPIAGLHRKIVATRHVHWLNVGIGGLRVKGVTITYTLVLSFEVRRAVVLGLDAFHQKSLISSTGLQRLRPASGQLRLRLNPRRWPTKLAFVSNTPQIRLASPGGNLVGDVTLTANAKAIAGRTVASVQFEYSLAGSDYWLVIGDAKGRPFQLFFNTTSVANGTYDLRAIATDNRGARGVSKVVTVRVKNAAG